MLQKKKRSWGTPLCWDIKLEVQALGCLVEKPHTSPLSPSSLLLFLFCCLEQKVIKLRRKVKTSSEVTSLPTSHNKSQPFEEVSVYLLRMCFLLIIFIVCGVCVCACGFFPSETQLSSGIINLYFKSESMLVMGDTYCDGLYLARCRLLTAVLVW